MSASHHRIPFSLLSLFIAITITACFLGLYRYTQLYSQLGSGEGLWVSVHFIVQFPLILIWTTAFLVLIKRRTRHPHVSRFALVGLTGIAVIGVGSPLFREIWYPNLIASYGINVQVLAATLCHSIELLLKAGCWWLLFIALLGWRDTEIPDAPQDSR